MHMKETTKSPPKRKTRLLLEDRCTIETLLNEGKSIRYIASCLGKSPSTVLREIQNHTQVKKPKKTNCINRKDCSLMHVCGSKSCNKQCKYCIRCKEYCSDYIEGFCDKLSESPYLCNHCNKKGLCNYEQKIYKASIADREYRDVLINRRAGFDLTNGELTDINELVSPLIKKGLSVYHVKQTLGSELRVSESTLRRLIAGCELDARNIDLREQVKRKPRKKQRKPNERISPEKDGHKYQDYLEFMKHNDANVVQMDCVEGKQEENATLLTLHFPTFHMQLAFIMDAHTSACVIQTLDKVEEAIGPKLFSQIFSVILTDNGHEFMDIQSMERSLYGGNRTKIFFCEPNRSDEKGSCENNHKLIRYVIPKGSSLESYNQSDISLMMNHINSYKRKTLYGKSPYDVAMQILPEDFFIFLGLEAIPSDQILLHKSLLKHPR